MPGVEVEALAARDPERAAPFCAKHKIPRVVASYEELVKDPEVDAVYIALPNGLHGRWTLAALAAGKHVLCEKPFTADAAEARTVAGAASTSGLVVAEAFHYRYHPLAARLSRSSTRASWGRSATSRSPSRRRSRGAGTSATASTSPGAR